MHVRTACSIAFALQTAVADGLPANEARLLLQYLCGLSRTQLLTQDQHILSDTERQAYTDLCVRRLHGEPIAYLLGEREFYGLSFKVTPAVLIPRPETERLIELTLEQVVNRPTPRLLDLGTGSGAIAISLAHALPHAVVIATDISAAALNVARDNAGRLLRHPRTVRLLHGSWFAALDAHAASPEARTADPIGLFDVIVSNPPYIRANDVHLSQGDLRFEPNHALTDGADGMSAIREIVNGAPSWLKPEGSLLIEHGYDQATEVRRLLQARGFLDVFSACDLAGIERISGGYWSS